jgi:hypothetical protein
MLSIATDHALGYDRAGKLGTISGDIVWVKGNAYCASNADES